MKEASGEDEREPLLGDAAPWTRGGTFVSYVGESGADAILLSSASTFAVPSESLTWSPLPFLSFFTHASKALPSMLLV